MDDIKKIRSMMDKIVLMETYPTEYLIEDTKHIVSNETKELQNYIIDNLNILIEKMNDYTEVEGSDDYKLGVQTGCLVCSEMVSNLVKKINTYIDDDELL